MILTSWRTGSFYNCSERCTLGLFLILQRGARKITRPLPTSFGSSPGQRYGPKCKDWELVKRTDIVATQAGIRYIPGPNVKIGRNYTLNATIDGRVRIFKDSESYRKIIAVIPEKTDKRVFKLQSFDE